jgi:hypothetical protein
VLDAPLVLLGERPEKCVVVLCEQPILALVQRGVLRTASQAVLDHRQSPQGSSARCSA